MPSDDFLKNAARDSIEPPLVNTTTPSAARLYDYYLGGKDHFPVDREAAERLETRNPGWRVEYRSTTGTFHARLATAAVSPATAAHRDPALLEKEIGQYRLLRDDLRTALAHRADTPLPPHLVGGLAS